MKSESIHSQGYKCPKCSNTENEIGEFRAAGGFWTKIFDIQNKRFTTVTCTNCKFTEIYKGSSNKGGNVIDFLTN